MLNGLLRARRCLQFIPQSLVQEFVCFRIVDLVACALRSSIDSQQRKAGSETHVQVERMLRHVRTGFGPDNVLRARSLLTNKRVDELCRIHLAAKV